MPSSSTENRLISCHSEDNLFPALSLSRNFSNLAERPIQHRAGDARTIAGPGFRFASIHPEIHFRFSFL